MKTILDSWLLGGLSYPALTFLMITALKSSGIVLLAGALTMCLRQRAALFRLWAWRACLVGLVSLLVWPFVPMALDSWRVQVAAGGGAEMQAVVATATRLNVVQEWPREVAPEVFRPERSAGFTLAATPAVPLARMRTPWLSRVEHWVFRGWWGVAGLLLGLRVLRALCGHWWLRHHAEGVRGEQGWRLVRGLKSPVVTGWRRAQIWLPSEAEEWPETKIRAVCLHEMAHHERRDGAWQWLGWASACMLWWNPLCWVALKQMTAEAERSADETALGHDIAATDYAQVLVEIASGGGVRRPSAGVPMLGRSDIRQRVESILSGVGMRSRFGKKGRWGIAMLGLAAVVAAGVEVRQVQMPEPTGPLTPTEKEWVERGLNLLEDRLAKQTGVHLKMKQSWTIAGPGPKTVSSPQPSVIEAWVNEMGQRSRVEYRPHVTPWTNGASPWYIENETEATNGQKGWRYDGDDVKTLRESRDPNAMFFSPWKQNQESLLMVCLRRMRESGFKNFGFDQSTVEEKEGRLIVERRSTHSGELARWEIDLARGWIALYRMGFPGRTDTVSLVWEAKVWQQMEDGMNFPIIWSWSYTSGSEGKTTAYENEISLLETTRGVGYQLTDAPEPSAAAYVAADGRAAHGETLELRFVEAKGRKPIPDVEVHYEINGGKRQKVMSSHGGVLSLPLPKEEVKSLRLWGLKAGYVMQMVQWRRYGDPLKLPESYEVKLTPQGKALGGIVVNEKDEPLEGVEVMVLHRGGATSWNVFADVHDSGYRTKTDASGRWKLKGYEDDLSGAMIFVEHPDHKRVAMDYRSATGQNYEALHDGKSKVVLKDSELIEMRGLVTDEAGKPVAGCGVTIGDDRWGRFEEPNAKTDAEGRYRVRLQKSPTDWMTFEAAGFQPQMHSVTVTTGKTGMQDVKLARSRPLRLRLVDEKGAPLPDARLSANRWQDKRTLWFEAVTDAEGRCEWNGAPVDEVQWDIVGGMGALRDVRISASDEEQTIVFRPAVRFVGKVLDARSGEPVKAFQVTRGDTRSPDIYWDKAGRRSFSDGVFTSEAWWMRYDHKLRIEAEGYEPFETALYPAKQQEESVVIKLERKG
ncbi:M56 family metallopeptidase [Prosthecobacter sp.]|uniref:M56 family metallopeptidase n=1 Tax=Prosthecobacter sp. TaxID=1965333 RepID=UPI003782D888